MKRRQQYQCWNCEEQYSLLLPEEDIAALIVECPYCGSEASIRLKEFPKKKDIYRGDDNNTPVVDEYVLPEVIVTRKPD